MNRPTMNLSILIADNHEDVRRDIRMLLEERREWKVCGEAVTGGEIIEMARTLRPDLLLLDPALPDMDARQTIPEIKEVCPTARIVLLAVRNSEELAVKAMAAGASGLAMKSDTARDLLPTLQDILKNRRFLSPAAERCMKKYVGIEMKRLIRERRDIDTAIVVFERLEAQSPARRILTIQNILKSRHFFSSAVERCMNRYVRREMKTLLRERKDIDAAIANIERLEAQSAAKGKGPRATPANSRKLIQMKRRLPATDGHA